MWYRLLISFSLANLFFMRVWHKLLYGKGYFSADPVGYDILALISCLVLLTLFNFVLFGVAVQSSSHLLRHTCRLTLLAFLFFPLNFIRYIYGFSITSVFKLTNLWIIALVVCTIIYLMGYVYTKNSNVILRALQVILVVLFPYSLLNVVQAGILVKNVSPVISKHSSSPPKLFPSDSKKIVWLIFDETDMRLAFCERPGDLHLPEFDRFVGESLVVENAFPPAGETLRSLPALLSGRLIRLAKPLSPNDLTIMFDTEKDSQTFGTAETVFSQAKHRGYGTGLVGFYHPYPRILGKNLDFCSSQPYELFHGSSKSFVSTMLKLFDYALIVSEGIQLNNWGEIQHHIKLYNEVLASGGKALADERLNLVVIHMPVPHLPAIFDRKTMRFRDQNSTKGDYFDNLALADQTFGLLRRQLENQGQWESATVFVSSDHWWRNSKEHDGKVDHRVPFMLKLAGQRQHIVYKKPFNTVNTALLVLDILDNHILKPGDAILWLDRNSIIGQIPYNKNL